MPNIPQFTSPANVKKYKQSYESFRGIDLSSAEVNEKRSPDAINMIPNLQGNPVKRFGFERLYALGARLNGQGNGMFHAGTVLYNGTTSIMTGLNDGFSSFEDMNVAGTEYTLVFDGKRAIVRTNDGVNVYTGYLDTPAAGYTPYVPTLLIAKNPNFGTLQPAGTAYEDLNLCTNRWREQFMVAADAAAATAFTLAYDDLSADAVNAWVLDNTGTWVAKTEGTDFTVDRNTGIVTFGTAPGATPVTGADNVKIEAGKVFFATPADNPLNSLKISTVYGITDTPDRIFATSGGASDRWCYYHDPTYWGETWYSDLGGVCDGIIGYASLQGYLATFVINGKEGRNVILRGGSLDSDGKAQFAITGTKQGEEAFASHAFAFLQEPLFLTRRGVYAFTPSDITGERYTQVRSYYINKILCNIPNLATAYACQWKEFYVLSAGDYIWLLDSSQKFYSQYEPQSSYQYECYKWTDVPARIIWSQKDTVDGVEVERLYFGDESGNVCRFYWEDEQTSYHDWTTDGSRAIECRWDFPDFTGNYFWENKSIKYISAQIAPHPKTSVEVWARIKGYWQRVLEEDEKTRYFDWTQLNWSSFTWSGDMSPKAVGGKKKNKKFSSTRYRVRNAVIDEPFGLYGFGIEFTEPGSKYKG